MDFLNQNAPAIQAIASVVSVLVSAALLWITMEYIRLTRTLAEAAHQSLEHEKEAARAQKRHLQSLLRTLRFMLGQLPTDPEQGERLRRVPLWENSDLSEMQELASQVGAQEGQEAALAAVSMRWLRDRVQEVRGADPKKGYDWSRFPWDRWNVESKFARDHLNAMRGSIGGEETT